MSRYGQALTVDLSSPLTPIESLPRNVAHRLLSRYGQAFTVDLGKVNRMVDEMKALQLHPDHEVLTSLLKCCAHASPPDPDLAVAWSVVQSLSEAHAVQKRTYMLVAELH